MTTTNLDLQVLLTQRALMEEKLRYAELMIAYTDLRMRTLEHDLQAINAEIESRKPNSPAEPAK